MPVVDNITLRQILNKSPSVSESRCVASLDFEPYEDVLFGDLIIEFVGPPSGGSGIYRYKEVPLDVYTDMATSSSQGRYFNLYIKNTYSYERIA